MALLGFQASSANEAKRPRLLLKATKRSREMKAITSGMKRLRAEVKKTRAEEKRKFKRTMERLREEMEEIREEQRSIREGQQEVRGKLEAIFSECQQLRQETSLITRNQQRVSFMLFILRAAESYSRTNNASNLSPWFRRLASLISYVLNPTNGGDFQHDCSPQEQ